MLIRSSSEIHSDLYLLTLGSSCHYLAGESELAMFDACLSAQIPALFKRLESLGFHPSQIRKIFITHLHFDRIAAIPYLKKHCPKLEIVGTSEMQSALQQGALLEQIYREDIELSSKINISEKPDKLELEEFSELLQIDTTLKNGEVTQLPEGIEIRSISTPGHTALSTSYLLDPSKFLIVDEGFGFFNGRELSGPGGDHSLEEVLHSISKINSLDLAALCLPASGVVSGKLVRKHLNSIVTNTEDLLRESTLAFQSEIDDDEIREAIRLAFYDTENQDLLASYNRSRTFEAVWQQILCRRDSVPEESVQEFEDLSNA